MLITNKKSFMKGLSLMASFLVVFAVLLMPIFPSETNTKVTGLDYADDLFNRLSKGSSYFIPLVQERVKSVPNKDYTLTVAFKKDSLLPVASDIVQKAGGKGSVEGKNLSFTVNMQQLLQNAVRDADLMYHNNGAAVSQTYQGTPALVVTETWWALLNPCVKALQKQNEIATASVVDAVVRRGIETGHNFYSITATKVSDNLILMVGLLVFYVVYTVWYGFAIFDLFDGVGLTMKKSKVKQ